MSIFASVFDADQIGPVLAELEGHGYSVVSFGVGGYEDGPWNVLLAVGFEREVIVRSRLTFDSVHEAKEMAQKLEWEFKSHMSYANN